MRGSVAIAAVVFVLTACSDSTDPDDEADLFSFSTDSLDFGRVEVGHQSASVRLTVTNTGDRESGLIATAFAGSGADAFRLAEDGCNGAALEPGEECVLELQLEPGSAGRKVGSLTITERHGALDSVMLTGLAFNYLLTFAPLQHDFGQVTQGVESPTQTVTLTNFGPTVPGPLSVRLAGATPGEFIVSRDMCSGIVLLSEDSCEIDVRLRPSAAGIRTAVVEAGVSGRVFGMMALSGEGGSATPHLTELSR